MEAIKILEFTKQIALEAGKISLQFFNSDFEIELKDNNPKNLVTAADKAVEKFLIEKISTSFPTHQILGEESGEVTKQESDHLWIIDPIDGTNNFAHHNPFFAISIALTYQNKPIIGVIYAPYFDELFWSSEGAGSFLNGKKIQVSNTTEISSALLATGFPSNNREINLPYFQKMLHQCQGVRRCGAAALDLSYLAAGRIDGFWEFGLKAWDIAAAQIILENAGGKITDIKGNKLDLFGENTLASNNLLHQKLLTELG